ncbi:MAG: PfkB family carbohydrate kinase [Opitutaceae bacterium]
MSSERDDFAGAIESLRNQMLNTKVVMGFDAFVDESLRIVGERSSPESYTSMSTIADFGAWASASAGRSGSREFVCEGVVAGGCSVNLGDGIATMGFHLNAFSGVGTPSNPAFTPFVEKCASVNPLGMEPGRALVTEFDDGKLMFCSFSHFAQFTPEYLRAHFANGDFRRKCEQASGIAFTSWSVYPYMTDCWRFLYEEALAGLEHRPHFFFDLADPASRSEQDLIEMVETLTGFERIGRVTLSVNGNEANRIAIALNMKSADESAEQLEHLCIQLRERIGISEVSIHLVKGAATATAEGAVSIAGPYCAKPKKSVGAGDRFNAGFFAGLMLDLESTERLQLGAASSGFFVRHARSAEWSELVNFIREWSTGALGG